MAQIMVDTELDTIVSLGASRAPAEQPQPVFVLGSMRSGASLLALAFAQHEAMVQVQDARWVERFAIGLEQTFADALSGAPYPPLAAAQLKREAFLAHFGDAVSRMQVGDSGATHWIDASYPNAFLAAPLGRLFPKGRFIHVLRDVDGVVASLTSAENRRSYRSQHRQLSVRDAYEHWTDVVTACVEAERCLGSEMVLRIRRCDLIREPERTLRRCFEFIGQRYRGECLRPFAGLDASPDSIPAHDLEIDEPWRVQADVLSRTLLNERDPEYDPDERWRSRIEAAFLRRCLAQ